MIECPTLTTTSRLVLAGVLAALAFAGPVTDVEAGEVTLSPALVTAAPGDTVTFDVIADFGDAILLGGAFDISWTDLVLSFVGFSFHADLAPPARDDAFDIVEHPSATLVSVSFANADGLTLPAGTHIGQITFDVVAGFGTGADLFLADSLEQGFFDLNGGLVNVDYAGAQFAVGSAVPLPGSQWLLLGGAVTLLGGLRRRRAVR